MGLELDHVFVCCAPGAPEGDALVRVGLVEGSPNVHPGQGTANRRFFFRTAYLELLWVCDETEARSEATRRTRLWERWSGRSGDACPFGIALRPGGPQPAAAPFGTWPYRPRYLPPGAAIQFAEGVPLDEPELICLPFVRRAGAPPGEPVEHRLPLRELLGLSVHLPKEAALSPPSRAASAAGWATYRAAPHHLLELTFAASHEIVVDLRPTLALVLRGVLAARR